MSGTSLKRNDDTEKKILEEFKDRICDSPSRLQRQIQDHGHLRKFRELWEELRLGIKRTQPP